MHYVVCHVVGRDSSTIVFERVKIAFILAIYHLLKPLTDAGGEETGVPKGNPIAWRKPLMTRFRNWHILEPNSSRPNAKLEPAL